MSFRTSDAVDKLFSAMRTARSSMGVLEPTGKNGAFRGESKYAPLQTVQRHIEEPCRSENLLVTQSPTMTPDGVMAVTTMVVHTPSAQWIRTEFALKPDKPNVHGQVACSTYCRRVALASIFNLIVDEASDVDGPDLLDDDGNRPAGKPDGLTTQRPASASGIVPPVTVPTLPQNILDSKDAQRSITRFKKLFPDHVGQMIRIGNRENGGVTVRDFCAAVKHLAEELKARATEDSREQQPTPPVR